MRDIIIIITAYKKLALPVYRFVLVGLGVSDSPVGIRIVPRP